eukprot:5880416-Amphidinium_carterae.2
MDCGYGVAFRLLTVAPHLLQHSGLLSVRLPPEHMRCEHRHARRQPLSWQLRHVAVAQSG